MPADQDLADEWFVERATAMTVVLIAVLGLMAAPVVAFSAPPALSRFAFLQNDLLRYVLAGILFLLSARIAWTGVAYFRGSLPLIALTPSSVVIGSVFGKVTCLFDELTELTLLPDDRGLRIVSGGRSRQLSLRLDRANWSSVFTRIESARSLWHQQGLADDRLRP